MDQEIVPAIDAVSISLPPNNTTNQNTPTQSSPERNNVSNVSSISSEKIRSKSLKIILIPNQGELRKVSAVNQSSVQHARPPITVCMNRFYSTVLKHWCSVSFPSRNGSQVCWFNSLPGTKKQGFEKKRISIRLKMKPISEDEEQQPNSKPLTFDQLTKRDSTKRLPSLKTKNEYPLSYHALEFLPYNPLPDTLEKVIFPYHSTPLADYDDPYWPDKATCLKLVQEVRQDPQLANFPGTFLPPAARGAE